MLDDLAKPDVQKLFRDLWTDPLALDPSRRAARVTEEIARHLADLAKLLEANDHDPEITAQFLMRCIFSMFAEDVRLIPAGSFTDILNRATRKPKTLKPELHTLWSVMNTGGYSTSVHEDLPEFNGKIFITPDVLPLDRQHIHILLEASKYDWKEVEPAIFGTLLERALDPKERHKLGAHYTPRAYVERLVTPTVMQPLRKEWDGVQAAASLLFNAGKKKEACKTVDKFHERLLGVRVLDPACGSGNFLYVTLEHFKRLEDEILQILESYGDRQQKLLQVDPHQFLGLEINPRAAHIAEMVLWIGYLQWHYRTHGNILPQPPIIHNYRNIKHQDALIIWKSSKAARGKNGKPITRWDAETYKTDPVTGQNVPDEGATIQDVVYEGVKEAEWPAADFIVGNPPFIGNKRMLLSLGDGYVKALRSTYTELPESCDFVMYWWHKAAELVRSGKVKRFGFITTNSLRMVFNSRVVELHLKDKNPLHLAFAIPDHPWVDASDGAAVRISMTVGSADHTPGTLAKVVSAGKTGQSEQPVTLSEHQGTIHSNLTIGADILAAQPLRGNEKIASRGVIPHGDGFTVTPEQAAQLGLGRIKGLDQHIRPYRNGKVIGQKPVGGSACRHSES
ncbi:MAG: hypothetical protein FWD68_16645 [Alphaproteobacteria bacterium]|nr:hypothetical protein [Alphaproteobacteria bacterium]